ncbi:MAG: 16S rRNA (cytidine(1402)-2'-O)-methyltransferase [Chloroflexota bacterium]|nr:MAG: 16S rRNA (cytidine(1402)-2'-O)-methyltransferase [Chloroflexota bacterium]UCF29090.1 MAG: 16S rRNA (cytidine(1402)-2'-O)-methyltransferase [Chloroflexota bacterium]
MSTLYLVATPIGNLEDITQRALRILGQVDLIAAEDTRHTAKLLNHYEIESPLTSFHEHSKPGKLQRLLKHLDQGDLALVSDAGTPVLNDPGYELVRGAIEAGHEVSPIPGPSAPISALIASGLPADRFLYLGYLPRKSSERRQAVREVAALPYTLIFFETPHRLLESLQDLLEELGDRDLVIAREISKLHEEFYRGQISSALAHFADHPPRGEITLVLAGSLPEVKTWSKEELLAGIKERRSQNMPPAQIASQLSAESNWPRREIYQLIIEMD